MKILRGKIFYRPREIAERGLITNSKGGDASIESNYNYILHLIRDGDLKAKNYSRGSKVKYYLVPEDEIKRYNTEAAKV
jgi:hypothetical protein